MPFGAKMSTTTMMTPTITTLSPLGSVTCHDPIATPFSALLKNDSRTPSAIPPSTAPQRLPVPPTTSIARVAKVRSM